MILIIIACIFVFLIFAAIKIDAAGKAIDEEEKKIEEEENRCK